MSNGVWRETQNEFLRTSYADWFDSFDAIIYLRAPSWDVVRRWRGQQEVTLRGRALTRRRKKPGSTASSSTTNASRAA